MKQKRRWSWTSKNLRKTQSKNKRGYWSPPTKGFKLPFDKSHKSRNKQLLFKEVNGEDLVYILDRDRISRTRWTWW